MNMDIHILVLVLLKGSEKLEEHGSNCDWWGDNGCFNHVSPSEARNQGIND